MHTFKNDVRNKSHPEGSIAEAYVADECLTFCPRYLNRAETRFNRVERNKEGGERWNNGLSVFTKMGKPLGQGNINELSHEDRKQAQLYVIKNCDEAQPFIE